MGRAFLLSMDAIIAVGILFLLASFITALSTTRYSPELQYQRLYYTGKDAMNVLERAKLSAVMDLMPENFTADCNITDSDMEKTILDALGYMWAQNSTLLNECAENLTREVLNRTLPKGFGYEILIDDKSIYSTGDGQSYLSRLHTIVSGYELGKPVSGYFSSAYIARFAKNTSSYAYFGGYEGDGNITKILTLPTDSNVTSAYIEANIGNDFDVFVNGNHLGPFASQPSNFTAGNWTLCSSFAACCPIFNRGDNVITVNFSTFYNSYVGGGFLKVTYNTSKPDTRGIFSVSNKTNEDNYWFPGIAGLINIYSGFHVPGVLNNMTLHVKYNNNITFNDSGIPVYLIIGDTEIFRKNDSGIVEVNMTDSQLRSVLSYGAMSNSTVPLRLGMETFHIMAGFGSSDVVLITDRSGSMGSNCDVWSNESYDCVLGTCPETDVPPVRCSATCDDSQSICEGICGGTWTEVTPSVYVCSGESVNCCDDESTCHQCGGIYGSRYRMGVAKDADKDFLNTILAYQGSRAGLSAYGTDVCSYDELTYNNTYLQSRVDGYGSDCSMTCICCGINKAVDILMRDRDIKPLENSGFSGPSKDMWTESGVVDLSSTASQTEDTYEFLDGSTVYDPDIAHVSGDVYAVAFENGGDNDGWVYTLPIYPDGTIGAVIDTYEFDGDRGEEPDILHVSGDIYAIVYRGPGNDGFVMTVDIDSAGNIGTEQDDYEFINSDIFAPSMVHVSGDVYAVAYGDDGNGDDGYIKTFDIDPSGNIGLTTDTIEFDTGYANEVDMIHVAGDTFAVAYQGPNSWGRIATVDIDSSGNIGSVRDTMQFEYDDTQEPDIVHVSGDVYAVAYRMDADDSGWLKTVRIASDGSMEDMYTDGFEFDADCQKPSMLSMYGDYYAVAYMGSGNDGYLTVVEISGSGTINHELVDTFEFLNSDIVTPDLIKVGGDLYAVAYRLDSDDDGYVTSFSMGDSEFGLYDYWYVTSDHTSSGSLGQNFTLPSGVLKSGVLSLQHGTSESHFNGTAYAYCNLTYPNASNFNDMITVTVWSDSWTSADNPAGATAVEVNVTGYLTVAQRNHTIECGAQVTDGGGETMVAFDNMIINLSLDRYNAMLVMSDGEANRYCNDYKDYNGRSGTIQQAEDEAIGAACYARDLGIDVFSVAFGSDADEIVMQKIACWNCSANDWYPGEEEDNCTRFYQSNNADELEEMYRNIAQQMAQASFEAQTINISGLVSLENALYPESYLRYNYTPYTTLDYGEVAISLESGRFGGNVESPKLGSFYVPGGSRILDAHVTSYSSEYWTSLVALNTSATGGSWTNIYNISVYGDTYTEIGDPFTLNLPAGLLSVGENNSVSVDTAVSSEYSTGGSPYDKAIYHVAVEGIVGYGDVYPTLENATADAVQRLENRLSEFNIAMLEVVTPTNYVAELPSLWGPSVMEIRIWS